MLSCAVRVTAGPGTTVTLVAKTSSDASPRSKRSRSDAGARAEAAAALLAEGRLTYPDSLPITERHDELLDLIRSNQVMIVAGETGSGKSTQIPKL